MKDATVFKKFSLRRGLALWLLGAVAAISGAVGTGPGAAFAAPGGSVAADAAPSAASSAVQKAIREDIHSLQGSEKESGAALDRLRARPRAAVVAVVKDDLTSASEIPPGTLKAVVALDARELLPVLKTLCAKSEDWPVFAAVNRLIDPKSDRAGAEELSVVYLSRLNSLLSAAAKVAVLDGLARFGKPLSRESFAELIDDSSLEVRIATVRQFLATRGSLEPAEQLARWTESLKLKPYQARLLAMEELARLPASELGRVKTALKAEQCAKESEAEVKAACQAAEKKIERGGKR